MITALQIPNTHLSLAQQNWNEIPNFAVISGLNGAGKSQLLAGINQTISTARRNQTINPFTIANAVAFRGKVKYVDSNFQPGDLSAGGSGVVAALEKQKANLINMLRGTQTIPTSINPLIAEIRASFVKPIEEYSTEELVELFPNDLPLRLRDNFNNSLIVQVFLDFSARVNKYKVDNYHSVDARKTNEEIYETIGSLPPWKVINDLFLSYGFSYKMNAPVYGVEYQPKFIDTENPKILLNFNQLSTGEKIIVTFILWAYNSHQNEFSKIFLFDEIDAHLNPSLSKMTIDLIRDRLVRAFGLQVIMTSHSPSTVARCDDNELFWLERGSAIRPATKSEIIPILSDGIITVTDNRALKIFSKVVGETEKPILCVEGETDKTILETAWSKLKNKDEMPFDIHDVFDCYFLINLFKRGKIFTNYPGRLFIGLIDYDEAYRDVDEKLSKKREREIWTKTISEDDRSVCFSHGNNCGLVTTLNVPEFREELAGPNLKGSSLSIELLFPDEIVRKYCQIIDVAGGGQVLKFRERHKVTFAAKVADLEPESFSAFAPMFERLIGYCDNYGA